MKCSGVERKISAYLDEELESGMRESIETHLNRCGQCRKRVEGLRELDALLQGLPRVHVAAEFADKLVLKVRREALSIEKSSIGEHGFLDRLLTLAYDFFGLLERSKSPRTLTLDEFNDFPPLSMGYIYCGLLKRCGGE
jgi:hypothetical protein